MTPERHARLMELFDAACELPTERQRAFLDALGPDDRDLAELVSAMLEKDARSRVFIDATHGAAPALAEDILRSALEAAGLPGAERRDAGDVPPVVGEYELIAPIGAGAMGSVYRARQREPERVVALKILHPWLVSPRAVERFRFEAQALAALRHPCIPPIYAVGQHERFVYFAMELVSGPTLLAWVRAERPTLRSRVEILARACDAVHHANLRGFVHRDLKPDNIRLGEDRLPRVLDFGISGAIGGAAREIAGTPAYMSPEQLEPGGVIDVRADVYALGATAFHVLTGQLPVVLDGASLDEARRAKQTHARRAAAVDPGLAGDLDAILARALAVAPERRYASAAELGAELERYLEHRPVSARGGGSAYRAGRWWRRNRLFGAALAALFVLLVAGVAISTWQYRNAVGARQAETRQREAAEGARDRAAREAVRAQATLEFLTALIAQADPERGRGHQTTMREAVDRAADRLAAGVLAEQPVVGSAVHVTLAQTYMGLGRWIEADAQIDAALALYEGAGLEDDELLAQTLLLAAQVRHEAGRLEQAIDAGKRAIVTERRLHGVGPHEHVALAIHVHAVSLREAGRLRDALVLHGEAVDAYRRLLTPESSDQALTDALNQHAVTLALAGEYDAAEPLYREALDRDTSRFGPDHPEVATDLHHLAWLAQERGRPAEALALLDRALAIRTAALGADHARIGIQRVLEAEVRLSLGDPEGAERAIELALVAAERHFGVRHARYTRAQIVQIEILAARGRASEAVALARRVLQAHVATHGAHHWVAASTRLALGSALVAAGELADACRELDVAASDLEAQLGPAARQTRRARAWIDGSCREHP